MATDLLTSEATLRGSPDRKRSEIVPAKRGAGQGSVSAGQGSVSAGQGNFAIELGDAASVAGSRDITSGCVSQTRNQTLVSVVSDYLQLTKPRIVVMILVTTISTAMIGAGGLVSGPELLWLLVGTAAVAASAGAANQVWERSIDCRMTRTARRPLPAGRLNPIPAALYTAVLGIAGTTLLHVIFGPVPALVGVSTWLLYVLVYTPMKTRTAWNTSVGAIAGALPVLIGYSAMGGPLDDSTPWLLLGVLAAWQYPHFMSIAWMYRRQYGDAGFCMTTTVEPTGRHAGMQSVMGSIVLLVCGVALCFRGDGWLAPVVASAVVAVSVMPMLVASLRFAARPDDVLARKLLRSSLLVLPAVLAVVTLRLFW